MTNKQNHFINNSIDYIFYSYIIQINKLWTQIKTINKLMIQLKPN